MLSIGEPRRLRRDCGGWLSADKTAFIKKPCAYRYARGLIVQPWWRFMNHSLHFSGLRKLAMSTLFLATFGVSSAHADTLETVPFPCQNTTCVGELWRPDGNVKPPIIVMAHGLGAERNWGLTPFAKAFVQAGFAVFRFDYRGFGESGGKPRGLVDGKEHLKDWSAAVVAMKARADVDGQRMGLWGSSYSGGHVLALAAQRPKDFKAVSSQVPFVSGLQSSLVYPIKYQPMAAWYGLKDMLFGTDDAPVTVPLASKNGFAVMVCDECDHYKDIAPAERRGQLVAPARIFMTLPWYSPGSHADKIQAPTLLIGAEKDGLVPIQGVRDVAKAIRHVDYVELKGVDHFQPYFGELFKRNSARQVTFFKQYL